MSFTQRLEEIGRFFQGEDRVYHAMRRVAEELDRAVGDISNDQLS